MSAPTVVKPADRSVAVPVAVGVVVAALVGVLVLVGFVVSVTGERLPTGPALPPPEPVAPTVTFESASGSARFQEASVSLPVDAYRCPSAPAAALPVFESAVICTATVHADYRGTEDWSATVGFGSVPADLARPAGRPTAKATAEALFRVLRTESFDGEPTTVADRLSETVQLGGRDVVGVSGRVEYEIAGLPSRYDRLLVVVLPLSDGSFAAYVSSRPDDTPDTTTERLNASIDSLRID